MNTIRNNNAYEDNGDGSGRHANKTKNKEKKK